MNVQDKYPQLTDEEFCESYDFANCYTVLHPEGAYEELDVAVALERSKGNISATARLLKRSRRSVHNHVLRSQLLSDWMDDLEAEFLDTVESNYRQRALTGDDMASRFFLTTKGKERGYVSRVENTGKHGTDLIPPTVDWSKMSTEALAELSRAAVTDTEQSE